MIVLKDDILSELCGANDQNLKIFEDVLGVAVFSRGNEIYLGTEDEAIKNTFVEMISRLEDHVRLGGQACPDMVRSLSAAINGGDKRDVQILFNTHLVIPTVKSKIFPQGYNQALYMEAFEKNEIVFSIGPAGTGKTYLAIAQALKAVLSRANRRLILTRPVVEAGESLGFLPGDLKQKINPYLRPLYDAIESILPLGTIRELENNRMIEVAPLAYMRGRSLVDSFIILDEAQNTTREQMKMFLTRIGERSRAIITGDITQIDLPRKNNSGLLHVISILRSVKEISFIFFDEHDVVRNPLVRKIVHAYESQTEED